MRPRASKSRSRPTLTVGILVASATEGGQEEEVLMSGFRFAI